MMENVSGAVRFSLTNQPDMSYVPMTSVRHNVCDAVCMNIQDTTALAGVPIADHASHLDTALLPPEGFSLVDMDLDGLSVKHTVQQIQQSNQEVFEFDDLDDLGEGVNLVVMATYWWCKDCNIKQKFGYGESIEEHLHLKHRINQKMKQATDPEVPLCENSFSNPNTQTVEKETSASDVITSVYTIPSNSMTVEDQTVDTLIVFDDSTTVQVITKPPDQYLSTSSSENQMLNITQNALEIQEGMELSQTSSSCQPLRSIQENVLPEMKPIPVIPAMPPVNPNIASVSTFASAKTEKADCQEVEPSFLNSEAFALNSNLETITVLEKANETNETSSTIDKKKKKDCFPNKMQQKADRIMTRRQTQQTQNNEPEHSHIQSKTETAENLKGTLAKKDTTILPSDTIPPTTQTKEHVHGVASANSDISQTMLSHVINSRVGTNTSELRRSKRCKNYQVPSTIVKRKWPHSDPEQPKKKVKQSLQKDFDSLDNSAERCNDSKGGRFSLSGRKIKKPERYLTGSEREGESKFKSMRLSPASPARNSIPEVVGHKGKTSKRQARLNKEHRFTTHESKNEENRSKNELQTAAYTPSEALDKTSNSNVGKYVCKECGRKFRFENKFKKHTSLYSGQTMQQCEICNVKLHNLDLLNVHIYHVHKTKESTSCITCGKSLGSKKKLLNHLLTHPNAKGQTVANLVKDSCETHQCSVCNETLIKGEGRVEKHYLTHNKPHAHVCQKCGHSFRHRNDLYDHLRTHGQTNEVLLHSVLKGQVEQTPVVAYSSNIVGSNTNEQSSLDAEPTCNVITQSVQQILKYEGLTPNSTNQVTVTLIGDEGQDSEGTGVKTPTSNSKKTLRVLSCQQCGKEFRSKKMLYQHLKVHGGLPASDSVDVSCTSISEQEPAHRPIDLTVGIPFGIPCSLVEVNSQESVEDYVVKSFSTTAEGLVVPTLQQYSCALCQQEFKSGNQARRHVNRFGNQLTIVQCNLCSRKFHNFDLFNVHYAYIHQVEGSASCMTCNMDFRNKADFLTHLGNTPSAHPLSLKLGLKTFIQDACGTVQCSICQKHMWNYPMNIANHTKMHRSFPCPICQQTFPYKYAWLIHLQAHKHSTDVSFLGELSQSQRHSEEVEIVAKIGDMVTEIESCDFVESNEKFCCSLCRGEVWCQRKNIHKHLDLHARKVLHNLRENRYFCPECGEDLDMTEQNFYDHAVSSGHTNALFICVFCTQTFPTFEDFKEHEVKKHWLNMYFEKSMCEICGKELVSRLELKNHVKLHEERQGLFPCPHCKQSFRFKSKLGKHMAKHENGKDSYSCQYCGKLYMTKISLHRHEQVDHMGIKDLKHKCEMCEAQFINATHLRDHISNKHGIGASYKCPLCGMGFKHLSTYVRHKRVVHGGDTPYVCQDCGEKFPMKKDLQRHSIIHTGVNPFECPSCHKCFSLERTLKEHVDFIHRGIVRFMCNKCGSKFPRKRNLVRHTSTCRRNIMQL